MKPNRLTIKNKIIATNHDCLDVMVLKSRRLGFTTKVYSPIKHDVSVSAKKIVRMISKKKNSCIIFGGEPTVQVKGNGKGGRNQELVLQILKLIHGSDHRVLVSSISTDGIDGNTTCAGALSGKILFNSSTLPFVGARFIKAPHFIDGIFGITSLISVIIHFGKSLFKNPYLFQD
jgi:hydroxypyruvate reductase